MPCTEAYKEHIMYSYFGGFGRLARTTARHLVFETESGAQVMESISMCQ